ncbi:Transposon Ty3-G Gag-Pol polyprotein,Transposon Ty3-I Gag-Pol polyprotein,Leucine-rich repeat-containing protein 43 [Mytilus edulis]|uniref:Transposon Ty3-G Gag-Pol polyprotein,Transposon Ty3-I Gag-Pol polyprotein,Leucine-rich repeat-containing protein 43 n=1 Tax=Mytilus edulis TaxID=6550 RepID=A0A8S3QER4_MYTED|nr:Transposon Ty3-G Gag-Pol polyprotein,Transposon Ty3-I Gag-Pol polyprotein,Leucine-rich repeat-containing protein 43 [Mytilus edulis]
MRATHADNITEELSKDDKFTEMMDSFTKQLESLRMELNEFKNSGQRNTADPEWKRNQQCYNCGKYGHFKRECRLRKQGGNGNGQYRNHENGSARPVHSRTRRQRRKQIKLNVQNNSTKEAGAYIDVAIGNIKASFLVDTGATVTLISNKLFNSLRKEEMPNLNQVVQTIMSANGSELNVTGKGEFHIWIDHNVYLAEAVVADLALDGIIGLDFLKKNRCLINLQEEHMVCNNQVIPLNFTGQLGCYRVSVVEDTCIQPGTEALVRGHINEYPSTKNEVGLGIIEPCDKFVAKDSALMARTLVKASETVPLRFMNVSNVVKIIRAGTIVGNISPIQDVISDDKNITDIHKDQNLRIELQKLLSNCSENLSQEQKRGVENLLNEYKDLFAASDRDLGRTNLVRHTINTGNNAPVKQPPRRTPIHMREEVDRHIDDMLERGVIEPADGPWSSGIVLVKKKDGTTRFCVDYRKVNDLTVKDAYPLPRIDDSLEQLSGNKWFSTLDLCSGYWQVEMAEKDRPKTAFASRRGLFQFRQMPFGLACAPATFERLMERCGYSSDWKAQQLVQTVSSKPDECERDKEDDTEISLKHLQDNDKNLQIVRQWVQDGHKPNLKNLGEYNYVIKSLWSQFDDLKIQDGVLCKVHRDNNKSRVIVPLTERRRILQQCHDNKTSGHLGIKKTQSRIKDRFYWPGIDKTRTTPYHPQCDGMVERFNGTLAKMLTAYVDEHHSNWDCLLPYVMMAYRSAQHETTGCTPNRMMLGREVATPVDLMYDVPDYLKKIPQNRWAWELQERMEEAHHFVRKHVGQEMVRQKKYYDKQLNWCKFRKDDQVYVFFPIRKAGHSPKFTSYWRGPFRVLKEYSDVNYLINCGRRGRPQVIHVDRMRLCKGQLLRGETERNENNDDTFEPESVLPEIFNEELDSADNIVDQSDSRDEIFDDLLLEGLELWELELELDELDESELDELCLRLRFFLLLDFDLDFLFFEEPNRAFFAFETQLKTLCLKEFPCGGGSWRETKTKNLKKLKTKDDVESKYSITLKDFGAEHEKTETLQEYVGSKLSPWNLDYSWSEEAKQLREIAVKSPWLIDDNFILSHFKTLRIVDKQVAEVDKALLKFRNLEELTLSANKLVTVNTKNLPLSLRVLELCANQISDLSALCVRPPLLIHLGLGMNKISFMGDYLTGDYWPNLLSLDLSHNNLSDLLDVVRKLGTLPKLRNLILQGNPLALIAGYRGYTIDSLRKLNILDDIMISADEKHHYKGLARRREYILDEAKVTLEVGYIKGVPMPDEIKVSLTSKHNTV